MVLDLAQAFVRHDEDESRHKKFTFYGNISNWLLSYVTNIPLR